MIHGTTMKRGIALEIFRVKLNLYKVLRIWVIVPSIKRSLVVRSIISSTYMFDTEVDNTIYPFVSHKIVMIVIQAHGRSTKIICSSLVQLTFPNYEFEYT
jgi:hypothetical protein